MSRGLCRLRPQQQGEFSLKKKGLSARSCHNAWVETGESTGLAFLAPPGIALPWAALSANREFFNV